MNLEGFYYSFTNLLLFTFIYRILYSFLHIILLKTNTYKKLKINKQKYVIKNIVKSFVLFTLVLKYELLVNILYKNISIKQIQFNAAVYVANDFLGLLYVNNLPKTTKYHHMTCLFLLFIISIIEDTNLLIYKLIVTYTIYSYHAFLVNLYLGIRFLNNNNIYITKLINFIRISSYYNYLLCCIMNLITHLYILYYNIYSIDFSILIYLCCTIPIINDDIILLNWLKTNKIKID